jgi:hypothetical protein
VHADAYKRNISVRRFTHERSEFITLSLSSGKRMKGKMRKGSPQGQPSPTVPFDSFRKRQATGVPPTPNELACVYDYRERRREQDLMGSKHSSRSGSGEIPMSQSTQIGLYGSPLRTSHTYAPTQYTSPVRASVDHPVCMAGGGFDLPALQIPHVNSGSASSLFLHQYCHKICISKHFLCYISFPFDHRS